MPADTHGPFPFGAVRDLLGITRALYRAADGEPQRQSQLQQIGLGLRQALDLARRTQEGTLGRRGAWQQAERATEALGELVADGCAVESLVRATAVCLGRQRRRSADQ
jgi:ABC-type tungstate transport system permease subunit